MDKKICSDRVMWDSPDNISNSVINSVCFWAPRYMKKVSQCMVYVLGGACISISTCTCWCHGMLDCVIFTNFFYLGLE